MRAISDETAAQIAVLSHAGRPLILCDVDEVVLRFVTALEAYLERNGFWLDARSFALTGNVKHLGGDEAASQDEVGALIHGFFAEETARLEPVPGAVDALGDAAQHADIVMVTNMPGDFRQARIENLRSHGLEFPVVTNSGPKGPVAAELARGAGRPVFFLDDAPSNIRSVAGAVPDAHIIHFIADHRFAALLEPIDAVHLRTSCWSEASEFIAATLAAAGAVGSGL